MKAVMLGVTFTIGPNITHITNSQHINRVQVHGLFLFRYHISIGVTLQSVTTNTECEYGNVRNRKDVLTENGSRNRY